MAHKRIINSFILILIVSLACAAIYAAETGEISYSDSHNGDDHIDVSESSEESYVTFDTPDNAHYNVTTLALHI